MSVLTLTKRIANPRFPKLQMDKKLPEKELRHNLLGMPSRRKASLSTALATNPTSTNATRISASRHGGALTTHPPPQPPTKLPKDKRLRWNTSRSTCSIQKRQPTHFVVLFEVPRPHKFSRAEGRSHPARPTDHHPGRVEHRQLSDPKSKRPKPASAAFSCLEPEFHLAVHVVVNSCTAPRRRGRTTHQSEDVPYGGFGPDLPCYPLLSHKSMTEEPGVPSSPHVGVPHCSR